MQKNENDELINNILKELDNSEKKPDEKITESEPSKTGTAPRIRSHAYEEAPAAHSDSAKEKIPQRPVSTSVRSSNNSAERPTATRSASDNSSSPARPVQGSRPISDQSHTNTKKKKKKKKQRNRLPGVLILTTLIFAVSICLSLVIIAYGKEMLGIGKDDTTHLVIIPEGATTEEISLILESDGIIKSPEFFQLFSRISNKEDQYIAGEHFLRPNMAYETLIRELTTIEDVQQESVEVTFPEGITLYDAAYILEENGVCDAEDFIFYFNSGDFGFEFEDRLDSKSSFKFYRMEGYLFPDTYYFYIGMEPEQVCQKIYLNFDNKMTDERYEKMEQLNLTLDELITFASIVQKEASTSESMTMVASVFWNRLNNPDIFPMLQSDPTTNYAENVIKPNMEVYNEAIIEAYDTYKGQGLPPGAICNPGTEAIDAVLEAFQSDYFYFIANIYTGQTYFAATLEEHEANQFMVEQQIAEIEATASQEE